MESKHFAKTALPEILPVMLQLLLKQDEDADDDEWNISMAAGACIGLLAGVVSDAIVQPVIPFIEANIRADDWHQREAAVMAFGAILDGPDSDKLTPLVQQALPTLIGMMQDAHPAVKDTVAWTLGRITELMVEAIEPNVHLQGLIQALIAGLNDDGHGRIASNAAWAVKNLAQQIGGDLGYSQSAGMSSDAQSSMLSPFYNPLMETLMNVTNRWVLLCSVWSVGVFSNLFTNPFARSTNEGNARTAAYEALSDLALFSANDTIQLVSRVGEEMLSRMEKLIGMQVSVIGLWCMQGSLSAS
jgi:importin subunit beta-1